MKRLSFAATLGALLALVAGPAFAQNTYTWNTTPSGAWLSTASWYSTAGVNYPGTSGAPGGGATTDIARFALQNGTAAGTVGIDGTAAGTLSLGAIDFANSSAVTINSSTAAGILQLNGATVNTVANTLVSVASNASNQTISSAGGLGLRLGITNGVFNIYGDANPIVNTPPIFGVRQLTISSVISEANAGSGFTLQGGGNLVLSGNNTFTGDVTINSGRIQISNNNALGTTAGKTVVNSGGTLQITAALTGMNENIDLAGNGFTELATLFGALRIDNVAATLGGNLTLTGNSRIWVAGNTTTANGTITETGGARALDFAGAGTFALNNVGSYTGATTISQGTLNLTGANGTLSATSGITVFQGGTLTLTNTLAANNGNRVSNGIGITLNNGSINFSHAADAGAYAESLGAVSLPHYQNTITTSQSVGGSSALTIASMPRAANTGGVNFVGTGLGVDGNNRVFITANPTLVGAADQATGGIIGGWATYNMTATDGFFASYTAAGGVVQSTINPDLNPANWTTGSNLKFTGTEPKMTLAAGERVANSLTYLGGGAGSILYFQGNQVRLQSGGVIVTNNPGSFFAAEVGGSTLTAGTATNTAAELIFNIAAGSDLTSVVQIVNNGTGAVGITKLGGGSLTLNNANTFSGPVVIASTAANSSGITVANEEGLGTATFPSAITIKAGGGGGQGSFLAFNAQTNDINGNLRLINSPLAMDTFLSGGVSNNLNTPLAGVNLRASLVTNSNNNYSGPITITGNHFAQIYQTNPANTFTISAPITEGAGGFTGILLARGTGTVAFTNTITLPNATLGTTDQEAAAPNRTTNLLLPNAAVNVRGLNPQFGSIRLGGNSLLPAAITVTLGQTGNGNTGQFWLNGFNQTISRLGVAAGSTSVAANQLVVNNSALNSPSTLTFAGGSGPVSVFTGTIANVIPASASTGALALAVTSGSLYLNGTNTYTGGTNVTGTGTLGGTGSVTGSVTVGGGGNLAPGNSIGTFNVTGAASAMTFANGGRYTVEYDHNGGAIVPGTNIDLINSAGTLVASAGTFTIDVRYLGLPNVASTGPQQVVIGSFSAAPNIVAATFNVSGDLFVGSTATVGVVGNNLVLNFTPVPEPATVGLLATGVLGGLAALRRRRMAKAA